MWRPDGWDAAEIVDEIRLRGPIRGFEEELVEAGADAMLVALRKIGQREDVIPEGKVTIYRRQGPYSYRPPGTHVFIPDDPKEEA